MKRGECEVGDCGRWGGDCSWQMVRGWEWSQCLRGPQGLWWKERRRWEEMVEADRVWVGVTVYGRIRGDVWEATGEGEEEGPRIGSGQRGWEVP